MILRNEDSFLRREYGSWSTASYYLAKMLNLLLSGGGNAANRYLARQYRRLLLRQELLTANNSPV